MWSNLLYMLPVSNILYNCVVDEEIKMEGNLGDELNKVFKKYLVSSKLKYINKPIHATVYATYPSGTSLWTIVDSVIARFRLNVYIDQKNKNSVLFYFEESIAWKH